MDPKEKSEEKELLIQIAAGNEAAFRVIYDRYRRRVYTYALRIIKREELAEEVLHEVFLKLWRQEQSREIGHLEGFLRVVTRNYTLKLLRRQQLEAASNVEMFRDWTEAQQDTEEALQYKDTINLLSEAIAQLPPQQRQVFQLCREEGLKYDEVAERMDISKFTVKTHMQHALRFLRAYLSKNTDIVMWLILIQLLSEK